MANNQWALATHHPLPCSSRLRRHPRNFLLGAGRCRGRTNGLGRRKLDLCAKHSLLAISCFLLGIGYFSVERGAGSEATREREMKNGPSGEATAGAGWSGRGPEISTTGWDPPSR